jgi:hypothetical protein
MFRAEDVIVKQQVSYRDPGRTGANVLWDFSQLTVENDEYELLYSTYNDVVITGTEHLTHYLYTLQNDSLLLWGFDNQTTQLHNIQPEVLLKFPVDYGDSVQSYYYAHGKHGNRLEMEAMGSVETFADAYGMMILPDKDTLKHVLRTRTIKYIAEATRPISDSYYAKLKEPLFISPDSIGLRLNNDSVLFVVETFRWYEKGYRYPVFETVRSWEKYRKNDGNEKNEANEKNEFLATAFFYPPQEHYYLDDDEENSALLENEENGGNTVIDPWEGLSYNIYPNPVKTYLEVEIYLPKPTDIRIQVRNVVGIMELDENKGYYPKGTCSFRLNLMRIPIGNYILNIQLDEKLISEIIMKK